MRMAQAKDRLARVLGGQVPGELLVPMLLPTLWTVAAAKGGVPQNICVGACETLRYAYGQLGIRAELRAVQLTVDDPAGNIALYGTLEPSWEGTELDGHCILWLPGSRRFVDPTVEQYAEVARLGLGPIVGRSAAAWGDRRAVAAMSEGGLPAGAQLAVKRGDALLGYTIAGDEAAQVITGNPWLAGFADAHRRAGVNLAAWAIEALRKPMVIERARSAPYPRLAALLDVIGDAASETTAAGDWYFYLPTPKGHLKRLALDEIPLPGESTLLS